MDKIKLDENVNTLDFSLRGSDSRGTLLSLSLFVKIFINVFFNLQFQVYQEFSQATDRCTTIKLRLYHVPSRRYRSVWYLQYADWAEQNCPRDVNHFLGFLEELSSVRLASTQEVPPGHNTNPPVLLHCMEGGGRSGVTLTADLLFYTLNHNEVR